MFTSEGDKGWRYLNARSRSKIERLIQSAGTASNACLRRSLTLEGSCELDGRTVGRITIPTNAEVQVWANCPKDNIKKIPSRGVVANPRIVTIFLPKAIITIKADGRVAVRLYAGGTTISRPNGRALGALK